MDKTITHTTVMTIMLPLSNKLRTTVRMRERIGEALRLIHCAQVNPIIMEQQL